MAKPRTTGSESSIQTYQAKRDFKTTPEPRAGDAARRGGSMFVVQRHAAHRAGLHWDFRLEHNGVLWSWAVPKGPSLDPTAKRMAIHVEDHPIEYADFEGTIPDGQYGGGSVETWDNGTWEPLTDPDEGMRKGELKFVLTGRRLNGRFTLVRLRRREARKQEAWFLIKGHDDAAKAGADAAVLEQTPIRRTAKMTADAPPAAGAVRGVVPANQRPQLCTLVEVPPKGDGWISEIKFDGYRLLARIEDGQVRLITRNGKDWSDRLPSVAKELGRLKIKSAVLDGELVALRDDGVSSFPDLQAALSAKRDGKLYFYVFDLLALDGWDLRGCGLIDRKAALKALGPWKGMVRFSEHLDDDLDKVSDTACKMHLEGVVFKQANAPYRAGRGGGWRKLKCAGRDEFVILGWTPPKGRRTGIGSLHLGYRDADGGWQYAGGAGTGFSDGELESLRKQLNALKGQPPEGLQIAGDPIDETVQWVRPALVAEVSYTAWSGAGRLRHAVYLGIREDKAPDEVVRPLADPETERWAFAGSDRKSQKNIAVPARARPVREPPAAAPASPSQIVVAKAPRKRSAMIGDVELTHPDKELWPGITKRELATYWQTVADYALPGLAGRPLSILRCPDGINGEHFFQKNGHGHLPHQIREGTAAGSPYLAIHDLNGLLAMTQMSAIELHPWGVTEADPLHPDRLVFDLDPGGGVAFSTVIEAAHEVRERLEKLGLQSFCRTTGGKGLHVVVPLTPSTDWDAAKGFCRALAGLMSEEAPEQFVAHVKISDRSGRILVDWLRNGIGATAISSYCPRARPGAMVATPLAWTEVKKGLDPSAFTVMTFNKRLARLRKDPWQGFADLEQHLPPLAPPPQRVTASIVSARRPRRRD